MCDGVFWLLICSWETTRGVSVARIHLHRLNTTGDSHTSMVSLTSSNLSVHETFVARLEFLAFASLTLG
jgi:hypothetical protein